MNWRSGESGAVWGPPLVLGLLTLGTALAIAFQWRMLFVLRDAQRRPFSGELACAAFGLAHMLGWFSALLVFASEEANTSMAGSGSYEVKLCFGATLIPQAASAFLGVRFGSFALLLTMFVGFIFVTITVISPIDAVPGHAEWCVGCWQH